MYDYTIFMQDAAHERIKDLIKDAENEHQAHEFLKAHPECKTSSKIWAAIHRLSGLKQKAEDTPKQGESLQERRV